VFSGVSFFFFAWMLLLRREAGGNRKRKKERVRRRQSQGRERERENATDARRFPTTEEGKRKKKFFEHERPCGSILGIALLLQRDLPVSQCVVFA
jgi:hypothetical protein